MDPFDFLLRAPPAPSAFASVEESYTRLESMDAAWTGSIDRAAAGGFVADRLGIAFVAGYRAALQRLDPALSRASLCATEEGGAHPRAIRSRLEPSDGGFVLSGTKTFATLASRARTLLVVASVGESEGKNRLRVARIPADRAGVTIRDRAPVPFAPEIPHAEVVFETVRVEADEVLEGDGYERVLKPFRTHEDAHVLASALGYLVQIARRFGPDEAQVEDALATLASLRDVSARDPLAPSTHLVLAGALMAADRVAASADFGKADEATRTRWERDRPLLAVAGTARGKRREAAWRALVD
jgi:acyl-CoA dehydrogenase